MNYRKLSLGLGIFSIGLGAIEILAPRRIASALGDGRKAALVGGFGVRELLAGANLLSAPSRPAAVWSRVAGDSMDLAALTAAACRSPRNHTVWSAAALVVAATVLDICVARGLTRSAA